MASPSIPRSRTFGLRAAVLSASAVAACNHASTPPTDAGTDGPSDVAAPEAACGPLAVSTDDAGGPNIPVPASGCVRDVDCPSGQYCYASSRRCIDAAMVGSAGDGRGGHQDDGSACHATFGAPTTCDATALAWSASQDISRESSSLVESDTVIAADGHGNLVAAWASMSAHGAPVSQRNRLAVSHDDGAHFMVLDAPTSAPNAAANDAQLAYDDATSTWFYVWEGYEANFQGAQHVWLATSHDGTTWTAPARVDPASDSPTGATLDFPWLSIDPRSHRPVVSYMDAPNQTLTQLRLIAAGGTDGADGGASASVELDDGSHGHAVFSLASHAFDANGRLYAAWLIIGDTGTETGGTLSGGTRNGIYVAHFDPGDASGGVVGLARAGADVRVSATTDAVAAERPAIVVAPDGSKLYVAYVAGVQNATDVLVATSTDQGRSFGAPVTVNDDGTCATHFHESLALDARNRLYALWYDNRDGDGHFVYAVSDDGGGTFHPNRLVAAPAFPFDTFQYSTGWLGDYFAPAVAGGALYALWSDGREGDQSHAFFARATLPP